MSSNPIHQFEIKRLIPLEIAGYDISFTNSSAMMTVALLVIFTFLYFSGRDLKTIPTRLQALAETIFKMIDGMIMDTSGPEARKFMPFVFSLFLFILTCNLLGMIPFSFTVTSHIIVTFAMAGFIFVSVTLIGFARHGLHYFSLFLPSGTPLAIAPILFVIEFFAYFIRPISLSVRLAANMTAGHVVLKVIATLTIMSGIFGVLPFMLLTLLIGFEIFVALIQAYIFTVLTCVYLSDAIKLH